MKKNICFAYYADGKFIGWYADSFGSVRDCPKLYNNSEKQLETIKSNFRNKIKKINETSFEKAKDKVIGLQAFSLLTFDSEDQLRGKDIELRVVECPIYDGPNPDFNKEEHEKLMSERLAKLKPFLKKNGVDYDNDGPSLQRTQLIDKFNEENGKIEINNWIYADYSKVKEWAKDEPTKFIEVIKP